MSGLEARPAPSARYLLLAATLFLAVGGLLMIYSASFRNDFSAFGNSYYHVGRQAIYLVVGLLGMLVCWKLPPRLIRVGGCLYWS
jgi:cell division protein FtsW